jgi:hypothetical protein
MVLGPKFFMNPSDSVAIIAANAQAAIPYFKGGLKVRRRPHLEAVCMLRSASCIRALRQHDQYNDSVAIIAAKAQAGILYFRARPQGAAPLLVPVECFSHVEAVLGLCIMVRQLCLAISIMVLGQAICW